MSLENDIDKRITECKEKIVDLEEAKEILLQYPQLYSYWSPEEFIRKIKVVKRYTTIHETMDYLSERCQRDIYGRYPDDKDFNGVHSDISFYFSYYVKYLEIFGKSIENGDAPLQPDDCFDIVYHWEIAFKQGEVDPEVFTIKDGKITLCNVKVL